MIRFIDLKDQTGNIDYESGEREFAFYDTVRDEFVNVGSSYTFESIAELEEYHKDGCDYELDRLKGLIPNDFFEIKKVLTDEEVWKAIELYRSGMNADNNKGLMLGEWVELHKK